MKTVVLLTAALTGIASPSASSERPPPIGLLDLTALLTPAYLAQDFTVICSIDDRSFPQRTGGPRGSVHEYVQHMKAEISAARTSKAGGAGF